MKIVLASGATVISLDDRYTQYYNGQLPFMLRQNVPRKINRDRLESGRQPNIRLRGQKAFSRLFSGQIRRLTDWEKSCHIRGVYN